MEYDIEHIKKEMIQLMTGIVNCSHCKKFVEGEELDKQHFPGFIGKEYKGLVIIGRNPGSSGSANRREIDKRTFNSLSSFKNNPTKSFDAYQDALKSAMEEWTVWKKSKDLRDEFFYKRHNIEPDNIAFINLAKCRLKDPKKKLIPNICLQCTKECFKNFTQKQLEVLNPTHIIYLFKGVRDTLTTKLNYRLPPGCNAGAYDRVGPSLPDAQRDREKREEEIKKVIIDFVAHCKSQTG